MFFKKKLKTARDFFDLYDSIEKSLYQKSHSDWSNRLKDAITAGGATFSEILGNAGVILLKLNETNIPKEIEIATEVNMCVDYYRKYFKEY